MEKEIDLSNMVTESRNERTRNLDKMTPLEVVTMMNEEDHHVAEAVRTQLPQIAKVVEWCITGLSGNGRLIYTGAGTSGRLGLLDAVECPPTFGVAPEKVVGLIAGGERAFVKAVEGAEDSLEGGAADLAQFGLTAEDVVVGIAASGRTPYVIGALRYARELGCHTAAIVCNRNSSVGKEAEEVIELIAGAEVLTGSTRLKAGTAQKMVCNMISTASMVGIGKAYENLMVDVVQTNEKLVTRAENIVMAAADCEREAAKEALAQADGNAKTAIVMLLTDCTAKEAVTKLEKAKDMCGEQYNAAKNFLTGELRDIFRIVEKQRK